jgi:hypothetical protein
MLSGSSGVTRAVLLGRCGASGPPTSQARPFAVVQLVMGRIGSAVQRLITGRSRRNQRRLTRTPRLTAPRACVLALAGMRVSACCPRSGRERFRRRLPGYNFVPIRLCAVLRGEMRPIAAPPPRPSAAVPLRRCAPAPRLGHPARPLLMSARRSCSHPCSRPSRACRRHRDCTTPTWKRTTAVLA